MKKSIFKGAATALITPANKEGAPDLAAYKKLIDWQIAEGIDALVSCGTTGESATLSEKEYEEVLAAGAEAAGGRVLAINPICIRYGSYTSSIVSTSSPIVELKVSIPTGPPV